SNVVSVTTSASIPVTVPVSNFASTAKTSTTADFSWSPANNAASIIIEQSLKGTNTWAAAITGTIAPTAGSATVTGLSPSTEYDFRLVVTGGSNAGTSNVVSVTTSASIPVTVPVSNFASTAKTSTTADFSWSPANNAASIIIEQSLKGTNTWAAAITGTIAPTAGSATVTGLSPSTEYDFRLVVTGGSNAGISNTASVITDAVLPPDPVYAIAPIGNQVLTPLTVGYTTQETKNITITRTGTGTLNQLAVALEGAGANEFEITQPAVPTLDESTPATIFTIRAKGGLLPGTYTVTVRISATNMADVTFTTTQVVAPAEEPTVPGAPQNVAAVGGNKTVDLSWHAVAGADYYKVYMKNAEGTYSSLPIATVTVPAYRVQDLTNGTIYFFKVTAGNAGGESVSSAEATAKPITVPSAPTGITAQAGNGSATILFDPPADNGGSPVTRFVVTDSTGSIEATGTASPITVTGLNNGTSYMFTVKAVNEAGSSLPSALSNAVVPYAPVPTPTPLPQPAPNISVEVLVNGKVEKAGTATVTTVNNQQVINIVVDQKKLEEKLDAEGLGAIVTIPVNSDADIVVGELNGHMIKNMENKLAVLEIKTERATYSIPAQQMNIDKVSRQIGKSVNLQDIKVKVEIAEPLPDMVKVVENAAKKGAFTIVVPPVNFTVTVSYGNTTISVEKFNAFVERTVAIPEGADPNKITTGVVIEPDGTVRHVPTKVIKNDGKYYAVINSLTNSTYSVVWHPIEFADVAGHWSKSAVNDMGSRMVIEGTGEGQFSPDRNITRAEFAAIIVRGLGLRLEEGAVPFSDVNESAWYSSAIETAYAYKLINGYEDGTFGPNDPITREQAMVIIARAMEMTSLKAKLPIQPAEDILQPYADAAKVSDWALESIADSVKLGMITGRSSTELAPKAYITRAEVAVVVQRLLQKSNLI
ncbi:hypothetical protein D3P08_25350, partial [Paenibacillus nanensis]